MTAQVALSFALPSNRTFSDTVLQDSSMTFSTSSERSSSDDSHQPCDQWQAWARRQERKQRRRSFFGLHKKSSSGKRSRSLLDDDVDERVEKFMKFDTHAEPMSVKMISF